MILEFCFESVAHFQQGGRVHSINSVDPEAWEVNTLSRRGLFFFFNVSMGRICFFQCTGRTLSSTRAGYKHSKKLKKKFISLTEVWREWHKVNK